VQIQKEKNKKEKIIIEIPKSFNWVIQDILKLKDEDFTGEIIYNFKNGGICNIKKPKGYIIEYPPK